MKTDMIRVKSETVRELREYVLNKYGKMHGIGREAELAISEHIKKVQ